MKYIDLFLASSITDLHNDRMEIGNYIRELNDRFHSRGIYFRLHMCEGLSDELALTRKQDEYNDVIAHCDYFYVIVWHKIGAYTKEEFDFALNKLREQGAPRISTFFKATEGDPGDDVMAFMRELDRDLQHYYTCFSEIDSLKLKILLQLIDRADADAKLEMKDSRLWVDGKPFPEIQPEKLPFYGNHKEIARLKEQINSLDREIASVRAAFLTTPDDNELWSKAMSLSKERDAAMNQLHDCERLLLETSAQLSRISEDDRYVTNRTRKAIELFDAGQLDAALAVLDEQEREQELLREEAIAEESKRRISAYLDEYLLKINLLKAKGCMAETEEEIRALYEKARDLARRHRLDYACILDYMWFLRDQKSYTYATEVGEKLYYEMKAIDCTDEVFWANVCTLLGVLYRDVERMDEAESLLKEAYVIRCRLAEDNPDRHEADLAYTCNSLGILYRITNRMAEAEPIYLKGLDILRRLSEKNILLNGGEHANICNNLAYMYFRMHKYEQAEPLFLEAQKVRSRLGELEPRKHDLYIGRIHNNLGDLYCAQGRMEEAEAHLKQGLELRLGCVEENPINHAYVAGSHTSLGTFYHKVGRLEEAEEAISAAVSVYRRRTEENFAAYGSYLGENLTRLGDVYRLMGRFSDAEPILDEALSIYRTLSERVPTEHEEGLARACRALALLHAQTERKESAEALLGEALDLFGRLAERLPTAFTEDANAVAAELKALSK